MNAYILADELDDIDAYEKHQTLLGNAADMLRKQAEEIETLKWFKAESDDLDKKLFESIKKANEVWGKATESILKKAQDK